MAIETSIVWDDMLAQAFAANIDNASGRIDYDYVNLGVNFQSNARYPNEPMGVPFQMSHRAKMTDNEFRIHIHWLQSQADTPNFMIEYRTYTNGSSPGAYVQAAWNSNAFSYTSGTILQVTEFVAIPIASCPSSCMLDVIMYRDSNNSSGLFVGADPVGSNVTVKWLDTHYQIDTMGSRQEFIK